MGAREKKRDWGFGGSGLAPRKSYSRRVTLLCAACAMAPDLDVFTFRLGIPYGHWLGHRGSSHSLLFAATLASLAFLVVRKRELSGKNRVLLWSCFFLSAALHGVLDAMTNGGLGIAFFSPFDTTRYFLPWRPIEVSPISITNFFSSGGFRVLYTVLKRDGSWHDSVGKIHTNNDKEKGRIWGNGEKRIKPKELLAPALRCIRN